MNTINVLPVVQRRAMICCNHTRLALGLFVCVIAREGREGAQHYATLRNIYASVRIARDAVNLLSSASSPKLFYRPVELQNSNRCSYQHIQVTKTSINLPHQQQRTENFRRQMRMFYDPVFVNACLTDHLTKIIKIMVYEIMKTSMSTQYLKIACSSSFFKMCSTNGVLSVVTVRLRTNVTELVS
jgi:hypothetical protein